MLNWSVSNSMDAPWCAEVFTKTVIKECKVKLSMDGKGRAIDNVFIERLWRSVQYAYLYLEQPSGGLELYRGLKRWFDE